MNWGYKILLVYAVFVSGIMFLVFKSSGEKVDLVTTDYYAKELKYQQRIDAMARVNDLSDSVKYEINKGEMRIVFPKDFSGKKIEGDVTLYCPSDEDKDVTKTFSVTDVPVLIPVESTVKREYNLQLNWNVSGTTYYLEKKLLIN